MNNESFIFVYSSIWIQTNCFWLKINPIFFHKKKFHPTNESFNCFLYFSFCFVIIPLIARCMYWLCKQVTGFFWALTIYSKNSYQSIIQSIQSIPVYQYILSCLLFWTGKGLGFYPNWSISRGTVVYFCGQWIDSSDLKLRECNGEKPFQPNVSIFFDSISKFDQNVHFSKIAISVFC